MSVFQRRKFVPAKSHPCKWCGGITEGLFCRPCYGKLDGATKQSIRKQLDLGSPRTAIRTGMEALEKLAAGGVPLKARRQSGSADCADSRRREAA